jgi:O-antigen/teichoic acid export membrane protein
VGAWGLSDQALISATNFATMVLLARALGPAAFGAFVLVYTCLLFATELQGALVTQPHNVLGVARNTEDYRRYTGSTAVSQVAVAGGAATLAALAGVVASRLDWSAAPLLLALAPAVFAWLGQEFVRRVLYTEGRIRAVFANDVLSYGGQLAAMLALWRFDRLDGQAALLAIAVASTVGILLGAWQLRGSVRLRPAAADLRANWRFGKWLVAALLAYWCASQLYLYLAAALVGSSATGMLKAGLVLLGPLNVLLVFLDTAAPIVLARSLAAEGDRGLRARLREIVVVTAPVVLGYCLVVALLSVPLLRAVYGDRYAGASAVVALLALNYVLIYAGRVVASALRARRQTRSIFRGQLAAAAVALAVGWVLVKLGGVEGAAIGMVVSAAVVVAVLLRAFHAGSPTTQAAQAPTRPVTEGHRA